METVVEWQTDPAVNELFPKYVDDAVVAPSLVLNKSDNPLEPEIVKVTLPVVADVFVPLSVTEKVAVYVPANVGVPEITPVLEFKLNPSGSEPLATANVFVPVDPAVLKVKELNNVPVVPVCDEGVEIETPAFKE